MVNYPNSQPTIADPTSSNFMNQPSHSALHKQTSDEVEAIAAELGLNPSGSAATVDARIGLLETADTSSVVSTLVIADNSIVRGDGGSRGVQLSGITIDDSDNVSGVVNLTTTGTTSFNGVAYTWPVVDGTGGFQLQTDGAGGLSWSVAGSTVVFADDVFRIQDNADATKELAFEVTAITTGTTRTITMPDTAIDLADIAVNTSKVSNATHTTDVTGSVALTINPVAITNKPTATVAGGDLVLISDIDDSNNLKQVTALSIASLSGAGATVFADDVFRIQDNADATKEIAFEAVGITTGTVRTITMPDTAVDLSDIATNNAKVTNATHTGDATGSTALTLASVAITGQTSATVASGDTLLISDLSDTGNLKEVTAQSIADLGGGGGGSTLTEAVAQTAHGFSVNDLVYHNGTIYALADASANSTVDSTLGIVSVVTDVNNFTLLIAGRITGLTGLTAGAVHYVSETAGSLTATAPTASQSIVKPILIADSTTSGFIVDMGVKRAVQAFSINVLRVANGANGNVAYTGIGFRPSALIAFSTIQGTSYSSWGHTGDSLASEGIVDDNASIANTYTGTNQLIRADQNATSAAATVVSYDADGFTLAWIKVGAPTGTIQARVIGFR